MPFCSDTSDVVSTSNYNTDMPGTSVLPAVSGGSSGFTRNTDGTVAQSTVDSWVSQLLPREGVIVPSTASRDPQSAAAFAQKAKELRTKINSEFCYYYRRYTYVVPLLLNKAVSAPKATLDADADYQALKTSAIKINKKLNDIIELLNGITRAGGSTLSG